MTNERRNLEKKLFLVCAKGTIVIYDNILFKMIYDNIKTMGLPFAKVMNQMVKATIFHLNCKLKYTTSFNRTHHSIGVGII